MACKNVGSIDRTVRGVAGVAALGLGFFAFGAASGAMLGVVVAAVGAVLLLTAVVGFCPAYLPLKLSTCKAKAG